MLTSKAEAWVGSDRVSGRKGSESYKTVSISSVVYLGRIGSSLFAVNIVLRIDCVQNKEEVPVKKKKKGQLMRS